jgi:hypothetical protein
MRDRRTMCSATIKLRRPPHAVPFITGAFRAGSTQISFTLWQCVTRITSRARVLWQFRLAG